MSDIVGEYRADDANLSGLKAVLAGTDIRASVYSAQQLAQLKETVDPLDKYMAQLAHVHEGCKAAKVSDLSSCKVPTGKPSIPKFFQPVLPPSGQWFVVIDGSPWSPLRSRAIFEDPSGGTILERAKRRVPTAKVATTIFQTMGRIVDAQVMVGNAPFGSQVVTGGSSVKVIYPDKSLGDKLLPGEQQMALTVGPDTEVDVNAVRISWARASYMHCLAAAQIPNPFFKVFLKVRDEFGQTQSFDLASGAFSQGQVGGDIANVVPATKEAQYFIKLGTDCRNFEEYLQPSADALYKSALQSAQIVPLPAMN